MMGLMKIWRDQDSADYTVCFFIETIIHIGKRSGHDLKELPD